MNCLPLPLDVPELLLAIGMGLAALALAVGFQGEFLLAQQPPHRVGTGPMPLLTQVAAEVPQAPPHPLAAGHRIAAGLAFDQLRQVRLDGGVFFSTGGRPPPSQANAVGGAILQFVFQLLPARGGSSPRSDR